MVHARYHPSVRAATLLLLFCAPLAARGQERQLLDEVVAVVEAHSITLSELAAETRVRMVAQNGPAAAAAVLDRPLLGASLRQTIEERGVLSEGERLNPLH